MLFYLFALLFMFIGFVIKIDLWGLGDKTSKDKAERCAFAYWATMVGIFALIIAIIRTIIGRGANAISGGVRAAGTQARARLGAAGTRARAAAAGARTSFGAKFRGRPPPPRGRSATSVVNSPSRN